MTPKPLLALLAICTATATSAQRPKAPVRTGVLITPKIASYPYDGREYGCGDGIVAAVWNTKKDDFKLMTVGPKGEKQVRDLPLAVERNVHRPVNAVAVIGGKPCVFYDRWDKKTGVVSLFAQRYATPSLEPDGPELSLGDMPLDPKSYDGSRLTFDIKKSPDGKLTLLMFDRIQAGGIKLALCWVLDSDLNIAWKGGYQLPVQAAESQSDYWVMDNGHVYYTVKAVNLGEEDLKEKKDGTAAVKKKQSVDKHGSTTWFELHGETFNRRSGDHDQDLPDMMPIQAGNRLLFAGIEARENKRGSDSWVLYDAGESGLDMQLIAKGEMGDDGENPLYWGLWDGRSTTWSGSDANGGIYISKLTNQGTRVVKVDASGALEWNKLMPWDNARFFPMGGHLVSYRFLSEKELKQALAGQAWKERPTSTFSGLRPVLFSLDERGGHRAVEIWPKGDHAVLGYNLATLGTMRDCGCFVYQSSEKSAKGLARIDFSQ